jgi:autotransporter-associated beta strand protein
MHYFYNNDATLRNGLSGNGVVNYDAASGNRTYTFLLNLTNSGFTGSMNIANGIRVHSDTGNGGYNLGNGNVVTVAPLGQAWLDTAGTNYNQSFFIAGNGWGGDSPTQLGALRVFNCTLSGPITMLDNSRIGGSSSGATISGQVSGNFQLEILGTSANGPDVFVLTLAPASGRNTYGSTLVTRGVLQAGNSGAFTNAVTLMGQGRMRLNGNNITLSSLSGGTPENGTNCLVWNNSVSNAATLTVGTDGSSTAFDGIFGDGASQPFGLTKVGAGTLTLTAISSNTGPVAVNGGTMLLSSDGSFSNSTVISVASGATLDVNSRVDGSLNLTSGQTLKGSGTINGNVNAYPGSTVTPGNSVGTLSVQGNLTLQGLLHMELNRTNTPNNCDRLSVSGTTTYGGVLSVTNIGPALQVNDTFQLFASGAPGFGTINVATTDANGKTYTWQNNISTLGSIKVLTVSTPVNTTPTNIVFSTAGGSLNLSWPADHIGWRLQSQTNTLSGGLTTNWTTVAGSTTTNQVSIPTGTANGTVFFRLIYP